MEKNKKEIWVGLAVLAVLAAFVWGVLLSSPLDDHQKGFLLYADFQKADGLLNGADIRMAGISVGRVGEQKLLDDYTVRVALFFPKAIQFPTDSTVKIETDGFLGKKYIEIMPGSDEEYLQENEAFLYTQDAMILNELLEKMNAFVAEKKKKEKQENKNEKESD